MFADAEGKTPIEKPVVIAAKGHSFKDGKCTVCSAADPDYVASNPETGRDAPLVAVLVLMTGAGLFCALLAGQKRCKQR